jgi:hypothetical protein
MRFNCNHDSKNLLQCYIYTYIARLLTQYMHLFVTHAAGFVSAYAILDYIASCYTLSCISFNLFLGLFVKVITILFLCVSHCLRGALPAYVIRYSFVFMLSAWMVGGCILCVSQGCVLCLCVMISAVRFLHELLVVGI